MAINAPQRSSGTSGTPVQPVQQRLSWALYQQQFVTVDLHTFVGYMSISVAAAAADVAVTTDYKQS